MLLIVCLVCLALLAGRLLPTDRFVESLRLWATSRGSTGMVEFGLAYVVLALLFVPGAILTMVAGGMYGVGWGLVVVAIATSVADAAGFLLGRYVARDTVVRLMDRYPRFKVVDRTIVEGGWRIVALVRLNPTVPYSVSNYLFGVTGVPFGAFVVSSGIFTLPGAFAYVYLGFVGAETLGGGGRGPVDWAFLALGLAATLATIVYVTVLTRRQLAALE